MPASPTRVESPRKPVVDPVTDPASARAWLEKLVSFDTTSSKTNVPLIQFVAAYARETLKAAAADATADTDDTTTTTATTTAAATDGGGGAGAKVLVEWGPQQNGVAYANLVVSIPSYDGSERREEEDPKRIDGTADADAPTNTDAATDATPTAALSNYTGGIVLSGHSDVVPVDGQAWDTDPFTVVEKDGKLYGRGTCDMKGFIAVFLSLVPEWAAAMRARRFRTPLHLVLTYSEETDMAGCLQLVSDSSGAWRRIMDCEGAIIGEPTMMELIIAHKGIHENHITCRGTAAHSSLQTTSYNAIEPAARILSFLFSLRDRFAASGPFDDGFAIPYTTFCPAHVAGGQALNTTPDLCTIAYLFRTVPVHSAKAVEREVRAFVARENESAVAAVAAINDAMRAAAAAEGCSGDGQEEEDGNATATATPVATASVELGTVFSCPHFLGDATAPFTQALQRVVIAEGNNKTHTNTTTTSSSSNDVSKKANVGEKLQRASFYTEAGYFQSKGLKTVVCGPGSIDQAHKPNEFIAVEQLELGVRVIRRLVEELCF